MSINKLLNFQRDESRINEYLTLAAGKSEKEKRKIERHLLKPSKLPVPPVKGKEKGYFKVSIYFKSKEELDLFSTYIGVSEYIERNLSTNNVIMSFISLLKRGKLRIKDGKVKIVRRKKLQRST